MPQMAPMNWTILFINFTIILLLINPLNFFINKTLYKSTNKKIMNMKINWKW